MFEVIGSSLLVMAASLVGVLSLWRQAGRMMERNLHFLVSFSAGVFAVIAYHLATETIEHSSLTVGLCSIFAGVLFISVVFKLLPTLHRHHEHTSAEESQDVEEHPIDPRRVLISDAIHNVGDGILLAASFAAGPII